MQKAVFRAEEPETLKRMIIRYSANVYYDTTRQKLITLTETAKLDLMNQSVQARWENSSNENGYY